VIDDIVRAKHTDGLWGDDCSDEDQLDTSYAEPEWTRISEMGQVKWNIRKLTI